MFGLKAGILASVASGATMLPEPVFDVDRVLSRVRVGARHRPARAADAVPVHPRPPRPGPPRPLDPARGGDGRGRHPRRADPPRPRGAALLADRHRLRAHRGWHGLRDVRGRRRRGDRHHRGPAPPGFEVRIVGEADRDVEAGQAGEVLLRGGSIMAGYLDDPGGDGQGALARRLAAHRRPRRPRRRRPPAHRRPRQGHVHRRGVQRLPGRDRERPAAPPRRAAGRGDRHPRRAPGRGRHGLRRRVRAGLGGRHHRVEPERRWRTTRCPAVVEIVDALPAQRHRQGHEGRPAGAGRRAHGGRSR